jgi:aminoglycoside phosphotransferase (APT) family kinase protein
MDPGTHQSDAVMTIGKRQWMMPQVNTFHSGLWKYLLPITEDASVLYLGTKVNGAVSIAADTKEVHYVCYGARHRAEIEGQIPESGKRNLRTVELDTRGRLPYPDTFFDGLVVCDAGEVTESLSARVKGATQLFRELFRVLKSDGFCYVSLRKRNLKNVMQMQQPPKLSLSFLKRRLAGRTSEVLRLVDDVDGAALRAILREADCRSTWGKIRFRLGAALKARAIAVVAKEARARSWIDQLLEAVWGSPLAQHSSRGSLYLGSGDVYRIMTDRCAIRVPQHESLAARCQNNYTMLEKLKTLSLPFAVPAPVRQGQLHGKPYFAESLLAGRVADFFEFSPEERATRAARAMAALAQIKRVTRKIVVLDEDRFKTLIAWPVAEMSRRLTPKAMERLLDFQNMLHNQLMGKSLELVMVHGDFKVANILWNAKNEVSGILDWDTASAEGFPLIDELIYFSFDRMLTGKVTIGAAMYDCAYGTNPPRQNLAYGNLDERLYRSYVVMAMIHYSVMHHGMKEDHQQAKWCRENMEEHLVEGLKRALELEQSLAGESMVQAINPLPKHSV